MNKGNFTSLQQFPADSETWDFVQEMALTASKPALLGGENYILSGCEVTGTSVGAGHIVIKGELLPFVGGTLSSTIITRETKESVSYLGIDYPDLYVRREARFGSGSPQYNWADFKRITDLTAMRALVDGLNTSLATLSDTVAISGVPTGVTAPFAGSAAPAGWLLCQGQTLLIGDYPRLFAAIGATYGGNGTTNFKLPNPSGRTVVGTGTATELPLGDENPTYALGEKGGWNKYKLTKAEMPRHTHDFTGKAAITQRNNASAANDTVAEANSGFRFWLNSPNETGGDQPHENRQPYLAMNYIIKT